MSTVRFGSDPDKFNKELALEYSIYGSGPVQAEGCVGQFPFYFRSRHTAWSFTISLNEDVDPSNIANPVPGCFDNRVEGFFKLDGVVGYELEGRYGTGSDASYMPDVDAEIIIELCIRRFLSEIKPDLK